MIGSQLIRAYSKTQAVVAKSSRESELYGIVRALTEGLGMTTLLKDFGVTGALVSIGIDATAAMGMPQRVGLNKVRHVEVDILWIQEQETIAAPQNPWAAQRLRLVHHECSGDVGRAMPQAALGPSV